MSGMYPATGGKPVFNEFITPIGLFCHMYHDRPSLSTDDKTKQPIIDKNTGLQEAWYKTTMAWDKNHGGMLDEMIALAHKTKAEAWPDSMLPGAFFALEPFFRDGDNPAHNTKGKDYLRGKFYLNFKQKANATRSPDGQIVYTGAPGLLGPYGENDKIMPLDLYAGCTGRVSGIMFATTYAGRNFISTRLNNIQKYEDGERIGGGERPTAESQFGALKQGAAGGGLGTLGSIGGRMMI